MALNKTPYDNKKHYDSGRLRHKIVVTQDVVVDDGYGGSTVTHEVVLETFAGKEEVSEYTISNLVGDSTNYDRYQYLVIRNRNGFTPLKTMKIDFDGLSYNIIKVKEKDDPCTFLWLLCGVSV